MHHSPSYAINREVTLILAQAAGSDPVVWLIKGRQQMALSPGTPGAVNRAVDELTHRPVQPRRYDQFEGDRYGQSDVA